MFNDHDTHGHRQSTAMEPLEERRRLSSNVIEIYDSNGFGFVDGRDQADNVSLGEGFKNGTPIWKILVSGVNVAEANKADIPNGFKITMRAGNDRVDFSASTVPVTISGGTGGDTLIGGSANDLIEGNGGNDELVGRAGNDNLSGSAGDDYLQGDGGNDVLQGGSGRDALYGNAGNDSLFARDGIADFAVDGGPGSDNSEVDAGLDPVNSA